MLLECNVIPHAQLKPLLSSAEMHQTADSPAVHRSQQTLPDQSITRVHAGQRAYRLAALYTATMSCSP